MSALADYRQQARKQAAKELTAEDRKLRQSMLEIEKALLEVERRQKESKLLFYKPYAKQREFHKNGAANRERLFMAGNRLGKTFCGAMEITYHLTGMYPDWWEGRRWDRPTHFWAAGITSESTRDVVQAALLGEIKDGWGTGTIPKDRLSADRMTKARGVSDLYDTVLVKHNSGGWSELNFKSYERGREKWQGTQLDGVWFDEEPPLDIYTEGMTRTTVGGGIVFLTFTPLLGWSDVVDRFLKVEMPGRAVTTMTIYDVEHIAKADIEAIIASWPEHEREARANGIPMLGSGKIFDIPEDQIMVDDLEIPSHWSWIWGIDFGIDHPFAAVLMAWNRDTDTVYVTHCIRMKGASTLQHFAAMKPVLKDRGGMIPVAWPHDVNQRREFEGDLTPLWKIYKKHGLKMLDHHATFEDGSNATELGVLTMKERMESNRFKVFKSCREWFEEYRMYHRKDGLIVKERDDLLSATRMGTMMLRKAIPVLFIPKDQGGRSTPMAKDIDNDPWGN